jgi:hypothetical protein
MTPAKTWASDYKRTYRHIRPYRHVRPYILFKLTGSCTISPYILLRHQLGLHTAGGKHQLGLQATVPAQYLVTEIATEDLPQTQSKIFLKL